MAPLKRPNFDSPNRLAPPSTTHLLTPNSHRLVTPHSHAHLPLPLTPPLSHSCSSSTATDAGKRAKIGSTSAPAPGAARTRPADGDEFEDDLETSAKKSRAEVIEEGYDSDSSAGSDGGFGVGGGRKGAARTGADAAEGGEDDDDMFGLGKDEDASGKEKGKGKEFLEMGDIEGQEFGREGGGLDFDEEEYLPEDDLANTDDAPRGKRSKEGMGYTLRSATQSHTALLSSLS